MSMRQRTAIVLGAIATLGSQLWWPNAGLVATGVVVIFALSSFATPSVRSRTGIWLAVGGIALAINISSRAYLDPSTNGPARAQPYLAHGQPNARPLDADFQRVVRTEARRLKSAAPVLPAKQ
jgi:hypothetical protein